MSWLVDNANALYILGLIIAAALVVAWRFNQRVKFLGLAVIPLLLMGVIFLLTRFVISDSKQLEMNVNAMADAVVAGDVDALFAHIFKDFSYKGMTREMLYEAARQSIQMNRVRDVNIRQFKAEISPDRKTAKTRFRVAAWEIGEEQPRPFITEADFVREGAQWKLKTMRFFNPMVNQDQEIGIPSL
jgi:hypothetical protein